MFGVEGFPQYFYLSHTVLLDDGVSESWSRVHTEKLTWNIFGQGIWPRVSLSHNIRTLRVSR